jgi:hypothetical protein
MTQVVEEPTLPDVLVWDEPIKTYIEDSDDAASDFLLFDAPDPMAPVVQQREADAVQDVLVISSDGPAGPTGPMGPQGLQGEPGLAGPGALLLEYSFATPSTTWLISHGLGTYALSVELFDTSNEPIEGYVRPLDPNTIEVDWYYPTAGVARVFR